MSDEALLPDELGPNRSLPQAREAEQAVLGCVLMDPDAYAAVAGLLEPADFYQHHHRWIWDAFCALDAAGQPIDLLTVVAVLARRNQLAEAGGTAYLTELISSVPTSLHARTYAELVAEAAIRRRLIEAATQVAHVAYQTERTSAERLEQAQAAIQTVAKRLPSRARPLSELAGDFYDRTVEKWHAPPEQTDLTSTLPEWDAQTGGLFKTDLDLFSGRPGDGKSALLLQIATVNAQPWSVADPSVAKPAHRVALYSLEMDSDQVLARLNARLGAIEVSKFRKPRDMSQDNWDKFRSLVTPLGTVNLYIDDLLDVPGLTPNRLRRKLRSLAAEWGDLDLVIIDYLQLMASDFSHRGDRQKEVTEISRELKLIAREFGVWLGAAAQVSRAADTRQDKEPQLSDLRESGSLEMNANNVNMLHPHKAPDPAGTIFRRKARNAPTGQVPYVFDRALSTFKPAVVQEFKWSAFGPPAKA